jgi:hypothetical protein
MRAELDNPGMHTSDSIDFGGAIARGRVASF